MNVSVFGLGYVGVVTSACLARDGHRVVGIDVNREKVDMVLSGKSPIVELGLTELLARVVESKRLSATTSVAEAVATTDASLVCVGTPTGPNGGVDLSHVFDVCKQIGRAISNCKPIGCSHTIVIRSTVAPGTTEQCRDMLVSDDASHDIHFAFNPEFLREGTAIRDYESAPFTIIGTDDGEAERVLRQLYDHVESEIVVREFKIAEMIKYACNSWHAAKITFANEIGRIAKSLGVDGRKVMEVVAQDTKLNVSSAYMRPGFAFGGSCLPKDVRGLQHMAKVNNVDVPMLSSLMVSNDFHINHCLRCILATNKRNIGMMGLAFKSDTDDLRESPSVELAERLLGKGFHLKIFDSAVHEAKLIGSNKLFIESKLPHLTCLLSNDTRAFIDHSEVIVVTHGTREFRNILDTITGPQRIIDFAGMLKTSLKGPVHEGVCW
jgi:GDP-mannose 6-dehydrogenase